MPKHNLIVIMGETRTGKTTLGRELADELGWFHLETSAPLRKLFAKTIYQWEKEKDAAFPGSIDTTYRSLAIMIADLIERELGPGGYAKLLSLHIPRGGCVVSGVRKMDEMAYFLRHHNAFGLWLSDVIRVEPINEHLVKFPKTYTVHDIGEIVKRVKQ